jgi:ParB-like chromosome segregation protein Spo0J
MRLKASQEVGLKEIPIVLADDWTQEQRDEFLIKDNVGFGEWDWDQLANEWDVELLDKWGLDLPNFENDNLQKDLSDDIEIMFRLEVILIDENSQEKLYNELIGRGYECRLLTL